MGDKLREIFSEEEIERGKRGYESYCASTDWKSAVSGAKLPSWEENEFEEAKIAWCRVGQEFKKDQAES